MATFAFLFDRSPRTREAVQLRATRSRAAHRLPDEAFADSTVIHTRLNVHAIAALSLCVEGLHLFDGLEQARATGVFVLFALFHDLLRNTLVLLHF